MNRDSALKAVELLVVGLSFALIIVYLIAVHPKVLAAVVVLIALLMCFFALYESAEQERKEREAAYLKLQKKFPKHFRRQDGVEYYDD